MVRLVRTLVSEVPEETWTKQSQTVFTEVKLRLLKV